MSYSDKAREERYRNARKAFEELRGQVLTGEQMSEIFGLYDDNGSLRGAQEDRDAFMQILGEGWLVEDRSGLCRVAGRTREETEKINDSEKKSVESLVNACAEEIKTIVLAKAEEVKERFPRRTFVTYPDYPYTDKKIITDRLAAILFYEHRGNRRFAVVLTPEGIFEYTYGMSMEYTYLESNSEITNPKLWIQYAEQAINELNGL